MSNLRRLLLLLVLSVFLTGFSALLYQVVWQRVLGLFSGSDVRSVTIVTSAFLGGLGVGSLLGSFWADRLTSRRAVLAFGLCNLGIGVFALASRFLYYDLLFLEFNRLGESPFVLLVIVFISLLVPTTLMGVSLPLLAKAIVRNADNAASLITLLYGINTLGAGIGTVISGWYLIGTLGYEVSIYLGGILSLTVGLLGVFLAPRFADDDASETVRNRIRLRDVPSQIWLWCLLVFVSGFVVISLEIIWFRILDVTLKSNAYTFAHLLAFFLIGDALGSLISARFVHRVRRPHRLFFAMQAGIILYAIGIIWLISLLTTQEPLVNHVRDGSQILQLTFTDNRIQWVVYLVLPMLIVFVPAFFIGAYFPIVQKAVQTDTRQVGQRIGLTEVANILGNTLGGILTGTLILEILGSANGLRLIALIGIGFAMAFGLESFRDRNRLLQATSALLLGGLVLTGLFFPSGDTLWRRFHGIQPDETFIVAEDSTGVSAIVEVNDVGRLHANGRHQGDIPYSEVHSFMGALPALVHPNPERILIIGIGSSGTPYTVGLNPQTHSVKAVEIIGSELNVLEAYAQQRNIVVVDTFLHDPRYDIVVGDGRQALFFADEPFDIIQADAIRPASSHSGLLYSREYFEAAREQLADGGIMAQWNASPRTLATFTEVFPYVISIDLALLGSNQPINYDPERVLERLDEPDVIAYLSLGGVDLDALRSKITEPDRVWMPDSPRDHAADDINTDLFPRDEYYLNN